MRIRSAARVLVPLVVGALALAGCGDDDDAGAGGKKTYTIAFQGPLSGDSKQLGINMDNGVQLAIEQAQAKGDLDFNLKYANSDDGGDPAQAPTAAQKLIDDASVVAVVGPAFSGATAAAEPLFSQANLISVSPSASRADLTELGFTSFVRVITGDTIQGTKVADYLAKGLKLKKIYVIDDKSAYGAGLNKFVKDQLKVNGVEVVSEGIAPTKDYGALATKVAGSGSDAVYYGGYYPEAALLVKALKAAQFKGVFASDDGTKDDQFTKQAGANAEGTYISCACGPTAESPAAQKFAADYKAKFGVEPGTYSAEAFDATNTIIAAMKTLDGDIAREKLVTAVKGIEFEGVTHKIKFDEKGEGGAGEIFIYQVKNGKIALLGKAEELIK